MVMTQVLRLHQVVCGHVVDEGGMLHHLPDNKTPELLSLLEEHRGKAIIWCAYDPCVRKVAEALRKAVRR
jgi:hypothetical protein